MLKFAKRALLAVAIFAFGAIFGPLLIAGIAALHDDTLGMYEPSEATKLVEAYQSKLPPLRLFLTVEPPDEGKACGYEPSQLFPTGIDEMASARKEKRFSDYEGYYALEGWASDLKDKAFVAEITEKIEKTMDRREMEFLRHCIQSTLFSGVCMREVEKFGDRVERFPNEPRDWYFLASGHEQEVICTYLDAIAARRGLAIPKR